MGLEANLQLQRTARRLKDENEALRGLIVRLGHGNMIQATLDGIGEPDIGYGSHGHAMGLTAPGSMDFASMGGNVNLTKPNASNSNHSNRKISLKKGSGKRKRGETVSEEEDDEEEDDEEEDDGNEEEYQHQSKKNSSSRKPSNINTSTYGNQKDQFVKRATEVPKSAPPQKSTFDEDSVYDSAKNNGAFNFNNDWYPGFNQQVQQEQVKQQQKQQQQLLHDARLAKQANGAGPSRSPESSESLTSLSGSDPSSNSNTPVLATETPQPNNNNGVRRQSDELLTLNLSNQRNGNPSNNSQATATNPPPNPYQQLQQSNPRPATSGNPSQTSQGGLSTILNEYSRGGSGVSGSAMLGNNQNNGGFTAPTSQDRPSILRAGHNGPGGMNNGGGGNGGNIFPFIQPTHQNDALLNPNPIPFAFNLSNTSPPDRSWWNQMGGGMLTPGQDPNALDEKASAVAQALNGGNSNNNNNNNNANNGGGSDNNGQRSQSPFDLSSFLTGGSSPGNNPFSISNFSGGNGMDGTQRFTPTSPFGNTGGIQRTSSRNSNSNPFESFGKFINSPSPSSNASGRSPSANASNSQPPTNNNTNNNTINRSSSSSSSSSATPFAQSEHAQTFLRLLERKISSMPGSDSPYTSLGFQPPMHSKMSNFYNNNQTSDQNNNRNGLVRKDSGSSSGSDDSSSQKAALASTAASALEPNGVYSRLAKHPAFLSTNVQELEELVDAIGSNGKGKSPVLNGSTFSQQGTNNGKSILEENKDNVALLFGMLDRKSSYSSQANNNSNNNNGGGGQSPYAASPSPIARYAYGLTSPQLQHHHQLQQHLQMQQNRRS